LFFKGLSTNNSQLLLKIRMVSLESVVAAALEDEERRRQLSYKKIKKEALAPVFGSEGAAGADLHIVEECVVPAKGFFLFWSLKCLLS